MENIIPKEYVRAENQKPMASVFEEGQKIITHPSGVITKYTKEDLGKHKEILLQRKTEIERRIVLVDTDIQNCNKLIK